MSHPINSRVGVPAVLHVIPRATNGAPVSSPQTPLLPSAARSAPDDGDDGFLKEELQTRRYTGPDRGQSVRTFIVQKDIRGRSVRVTIGRYPDWAVDQARKRAHELIVQMDQGIDPNRRKKEEAAKGVTLAEAIDMHLSSMRARRCAARSMNVIQEECERLLSDWLARPLATITPNECAKRHERITERNGPYAANRALQHFRACYNTAARRVEDLPLCPIIGVTFNKNRRRREPISSAEMPTWRTKVDEIAATYSSSSCSPDYGAPTHERSAGSTSTSTPAPSTDRSPKDRSGVVLRPRVAAAPSRREPSHLSGRRGLGLPLDE